MEYVIIALLIFIIFALGVDVLKSAYKLSYYETKLRSRGLEVDHIRDKSLWRMLVRG
jgi:hypothetical protein